MSDTMSDKQACRLGTPRWDADEKCLYCKTHKHDHPGFHSPGLQAPTTTKQPGEGQTAFSIRSIQFGAWQEAHDMFCGCVGEKHESPYSDGNVS